MSPTIAAAVRRALASCSEVVPFSPARIRELPPTAMSMVFKSSSQLSVLSTQYSVLGSTASVSDCKIGQGFSPLAARDSLCVWRFAVLHEFEQNCFLRVQAIFRLLVHHRVGGIDDLVGDLVAAMGRQAMHEDGVEFGAAEQVGIHLVRQENLAPLGCFRLLAHACPDVRINHVGISDCL